MQVSKRGQNKKTIFRMNNVMPCNLNYLWDHIKWFQKIWWNSKEINSVLHSCGLSTNICILIYLNWIFQTFFKNFIIKANLFKMFSARLKYFIQGSLELKWKIFLFCIVCWKIWAHILEYVSWVWFPKHTKIQFTVRNWLPLSSEK